MKAYLPALILSLGGICLLVDRPAYASFSKADDEQLEPYLKKLQDNITEEERAVESLKKRYEDVLREKQKSKERKSREKETRKPDGAQGELSAGQANPKDSEPTRHSLKQKNQELLNSLEQSIASIQKKNKTIEALKNTSSAPPKEKTVVRKASREAGSSKEESAARKQLDKLQKEKVDLEDRFKALEEEHKSLLTRKDVQPQPQPRQAVRKAGREQKKIKKEVIYSKKSVDSDNLKDNQDSSLGCNRENKPGILKNFASKAKKLDFWWRKKVW